MLSNHPWFEITVEAASDRSSVKTYQEILNGRWDMKLPLTERLRSMKVQNLHDVDCIFKQVDFVFCAVSMPKEEIKKRGKLCKT